MNEGRTVFAQRLDFLPQYEFDKCVARYHGNFRIRKLPAYEQFLVVAVPAKLTKTAEASNTTDSMTISCKIKSYCIAVGFPHRLVTGNQAQKLVTRLICQWCFFRSKKFLLHGSGSGCDRNISELCKSLIYRHSLKNAGEDILAMFFTVEYDFDSMSVDLSGRNFAKTIAKDSGAARFLVFCDCGSTIR